MLRKYIKKNIRSGRSKKRLPQESFFKCFCFFLRIISNGTVTDTTEKEVFVLRDEKIISAIRKRDERMLSFVIDRYARLLWKAAASILTDASAVQDVEECVSDAFIYLWQHPERYDPDKAKLSSWLSMIVRSRAIDRWRRMVKKREISMEELVMESLGYPEIAEDQADDNVDSRRDKLAICMGMLDEKEKELLIRRYSNEQSTNEIAIAMNLSKKQVENKLYQVKRKCKRMMECKNDLERV